MTRKPYFPIFTDIAEYKIIVVGGGKVAQRRVETLLQFAEDITVIAPVITEELREFWKQKRIVWLEKSYAHEMDEMLKCADMVLAATDDLQCNEELVKVCRNYGVLVNTSHKKELCDFYFPAIVVKENAVAGVTASGINHMQAKCLREKINDIMDKEMK